MPRSKYTPQDLENMKNVSNNLRKLISVKGVTQSQLSSKTGIPASTLSGYFNATSLPNAGNLQKMADYFKVQKSDIDPRFKTGFKNKEPNKTATLLAAHIDDNVTDEQMNEILNFIDYIKNKYKED